MKDWAPSIIDSALFAFLSPGVIFQLPGKHRPVDFMNMKTSWATPGSPFWPMLLMSFLVILQAHLYI
ncbi:uncharacterized protein LOC108511737 [Phoenix dactylifera]|uniref:Uncharacterized protein LOC108511737 n=1 Tax=Phoenix dactylifera TaxID=42345 RepID=A0A8B9B0R7_PHODC|nr:uncharacterized protein LOC108511737 [Phoenix dactylifera]